MTAPSRPSGLPLTDAVEEAAARRRLRRNSIAVIAILDVLILAVAASGSADLRRMATPAGAAAAWVDAAGVGDCDRYLDLETPGRRAAELAGSAVLASLAQRPVTAHDELCRDIAGAWAGVTTQRAQLLSGNGGRAVVAVTVTVQAAAAPGQPGGTADRMLSGTLRLSHSGGRWRVDVNEPPCVIAGARPATALCAVAGH